MYLHGLTQHDWYLRQQEFWNGRNKFLIFLAKLFQFQAQNENWIICYIKRFFKNQYSNHVFILSLFSTSLYGHIRKLEHPERLTRAFCIIFWSFIRPRYCIVLYWYLYFLNHLCSQLKTGASAATNQPGRTLTATGKINHRSATVASVQKRVIKSKNKISDKKLICTM